MADDEKEERGAAALERYKREFYTDFAATEEQRDKSNEELRFVMVSGGQWEGYLEDQFEDRAKIELDQCCDYLYRTYAQWTDNRVGVNYAPDDEATTDDDAELLDGLFRRDLQRRNGQAALDAAVFETMAAGYGAVHLCTEYEDDEDPDNEDQCVVLSELSNAYATVVWDSAARKVDKSDAERCTVLIPHSKDGFERKYPDATPGADLTPQDRRVFNWTTPDLVYEAIRYEVRVEDETVHTYGHPETGDIVRVREADLEDEKPELTALGYEFLRKKRLRRRNVYRVKFCGACELEAERRIAGKYIPVIPFYAYRAHVDGVDYWHGVVRKRMDGQRLLNMSASLMAESAANSSEDKMIFAPEQVEGLQTHWAQNRHQQPYRLARPLLDSEGKVLVAGPLGVESGASTAQAAQTLLTTVAELITRGTGGAPQDTIDPDASGKAVNAVLKRVDMNTQPIFDNIRTSMRHLGEVYRCIAADIYAARDGRVVNIVTKSGERQQRKLLEMRGKGGQIVYGNDVSKGRFEVIPDTGPSFQTQREETVQALKDVLATPALQDPASELTQIVLTKLLELLPAQGMDEVKDFCRRKLLLSGIRKPETPDDIEYLRGLAAQQAQQGPDPQQELLAAASQNQRSEAALNVARIGDLQAAKIAKLAQAALDGAKRAEIVQRVRNPQLRLVSEGGGAAAKQLDAAIELHEKHMSGQEPTTGPEGERSQMKMMQQMKAARRAMGGGGMKGM